MPARVSRDGAIPRSLICPGPSRARALSPRPYAAVDPAASSPDLPSQPSRTDRRPHRTSRDFRKRHEADMTAAKGWTRTVPACGQQEQAAREARAPLLWSLRSRGARDRRRREQSSGLRRWRDCFATFPITRTKSTARSHSPLAASMPWPSLRRHLNHADRRCPALAARLRSRRPGRRRCRRARLRNATAGAIAAGRCLGTMQ